MHACICMQYHVTSLKHPKTHWNSTPHVPLKYDLTWPDLSPAGSLRKLDAPFLQGLHQTAPNLGDLRKKLSSHVPTGCWASNQARIAIIIMLVAISPSHWNILKHDHCFSYLLSSTCCIARSAGDWRVVDESGHHKLLWTELSKVREEKITGSAIRLKFKLKRPPWTKKRYLTQFLYCSCKIARSSLAWSSWL